MRREKEILDRTDSVQPLQQIDVLYLFACRVCWLGFGGEEAYRELLLVSECGDPDSRLVAEAFLADMQHNAAADRLNSALPEKGATTMRTASKAVAVG